MVTARTRQMKKKPGKLDKAEETGRMSLGRVKEQKQTICEFNKLSTKVS